MLYIGVPHADWRVATDIGDARMLQADLLISKLIIQAVEEPNRPQFPVKYAAAYLQTRIPTGRPKPPAQARAAGRSGWLVTAVSW